MFLVLRVLIRSLISALRYRSSLVAEPGHGPLSGSTSALRRRHPIQLGQNSNRQRWPLTSRLLSAACVTALLLGSSSCIVYTSPRCLFDKGDGMPVVSLRFDPNDGTNLSVAYGKHGFVDTLADGDASFCRRLEPKAHGRIMEVLEESQVAIDQAASFSDALRQGSSVVSRRGPSRFLVYAQFDTAARPPVVWWAPDLPTPPGHVERLDELFCAFERELSMLRRTMKKYGSEFLEARGRDLPCGVD